MRFKNWLKGAKAKAFVFLGSFAMLLGVGAGIYSVKAAQQTPASQVNAAQTNADYKLTGSGSFLGSGAEWADGGVQMYKDAAVSTDKAYLKRVNLSSGDIIKIRPTGSGDWRGWLDLKWGTAKSKFERTAANSASNGIECHLNTGDVSWWSDAQATTRITVKNSGGTQLAQTFSRWNGSSYPNFYLALSLFSSGNTILFERIDKGNDSASAWNSARANMPTDTTKEYTFYVNSATSGGSATSGASTDDPSQSDNIRAKTTGYYDVYLNSSSEITINNAQYTVTLNKQSGSGGDSSKTVSYSEDMPSVSIPTRTHYEFKGYYTGTGGGGTKYYNADGSSARTWNLNADTTLYAYWDAQVTMTYKRITMGGDSAGDDVVAYHNKGASITLNSGSLAGYKFEGWYTSYNSTTHVFSGTRYDGSGSYTMGSTSATLYGKYVPVGAYLCGLGNDWEMSHALFGSSAGTGTDGNAMIGFSSVSISAGDEFKIYQFTTSSSTPYGDDYCVFGTDAVSRFNVVHNSSDSNITCKANCGGTYDIFFDSVSHYIYIYSATAVASDGYYLTGTNEFSKTFNYDLRSDKLMTNSVGGNVAVLETESGVPVSVGTYVQPVHYFYPRAIWYNVTLGDGAPAGWSVDDNKAYYNGASSGRFNFYLKTATGGSSSGAEASSGTCVLYIVDVSTVGQKGYLYIASSETADNIEVTTKLSDDTVIVDDKDLDKFSLVHTVSAIALFDDDDYVYIHRIPILNLRGANVSAAVTQVVFNDGTEKTITGLPTSATDSPHYYAVFGAGTSAAASAGNGDAARAVFELCLALEADDGTSICDMDDSTLELLKELIEDGRSGSSSLMDAAKVTTFPSGTKTGTYDWLVSDVYKQICRELKVDSDINAPGWRLPINTIPGVYNNDQSPLTLTLWIVLGAGILGMGAIGTAYFVSKKKKKGDQAAS